MKSIFLASSCFLAFSFMVHAEESVTLEPMIITGKKLTLPPFNDEANSKNDFYAEELSERGMARLQDISKNIANFNLADQGIGSFRQVFAMRGLTNTSIFSAPAVVFYVDDVAYNSSITNMGQLFDIESLSVYRNAQPGSFGKNAYAGAVDIHTQQPNNTLKGGVGVEIGTYDTYGVNAKTSGALIKDHLFFNLSGFYNQRDGFLTNTTLNNHPDSQENFSGRASLTWKPSSKFDARLTLTKEDFDFGNARFVRLDNPKSYITKANVAERLQQNADSQSLRLAYELENYNLLSISSRRSWQMLPFIVDLDLTPNSFAMRNLRNSETTWTQEVRLSPKKQGEWNWNIGGFYSTSKFDELDDVTTSGKDIFWTDKQMDNYAIFGHLAYQGFQNLNLYTDLRLDYVTSHLNSTYDSSIPISIAVNRNYETVFASPKWGVDYQISKHSLIYASTGFGFKPGGLTYANTEQSVIQFDQETSWQNSFGIKSDWLDGRIKTNLAGFYYQIDNYQVERFFAGGNYALFNTEKVSSYGVEFENQIELIEHLALENTAGYTHIHFDDYHDSVSSANYTGNTVPFVPEFNTLTALQYKHPQGYFARAEWQWKGNTYFNEGNTLSQNAYFNVNLRVGYSKENYSASIFVNNLNDAYYYTTQLGARGAVGDPRIVGVRLSVNY